MNQRSGSSAFEDAAETWNRRFDGDEFLFGVEPNVWLREQASWLPPRGRVLCVADGEGRNSVWLARQGFEVDAFDIAEVGVAKARRHAERNGVRVNFQACDCEAYAWPQAQFDVTATGSRAVTLFLWKMWFRRWFLRRDLPQLPSKVFNVGTGQSVTINELWEKVAALAGTASQPVHGPARPGDVPHSVSAIDSACVDLGFAPRVSFERGLAMTMDWYGESAPRNRVKEPEKTRNERDV